MPRSCSPSPSLSHFFAIEVVRIGQSVFEFDPVRQLLPQRRLAQVEVLRLAQLEVGRPRDGAARVDQVGRVKLLGAVLALVAARLVVAAVGAGALDVAVGQEAAVGGGIELPLGHFLDQPVVGQMPREMLREALVLRARRPPELVEAEPEAVRQLLLHLVHLRAVLGHRQTGLGGGEFGRGAVLVGGAEEQHLVPPAAHVAGVEVGGQLRAHEVAQMLDPVDVGDRRGDEDACHGGPASAVRPVLSPWRRGRHPPLTPCPAAARPCGAALPAAGPEAGRSGRTCAGHRHSACASRPGAGASGRARRR